MSNRYQLLLMLTFLLPATVLAQVGIGTVMPDASAALDVTTSTRGLLMPRVALTAANAAAPLTLPATALLVYNTNAAMPGGVGFYYNAGTPASPAWVKMVTTATPTGGDTWSTAGNGGTAPATQFVGTTDAQDLVLRTNNTERLRLKQTGALWQTLPNTGNTALGTNTANALAAGTNNTLLGVNAGQAVTGGDDNTYLGRMAGGTSNTASRNTAVGSGAGDIITTGSNNTLVGNDAGGALVAGANNTFIGRRAGIANTASANTFVGADAGDTNTSGTQNTFLGRDAGGANVTGGSNTFLGFSAGLVNTASNNTFIGSNTGNANTAGSNNVMLGRDVGLANVVGTGNTYLGDNVGALANADFNTLVGRVAGSALTSGSNNTFVGNAAGLTPTGGSQITLLGSGTDASPNLTNATALGNGATVTASNALVLGNSSVNVGIGVNNPAQRLHVNGTNGTPNVRLTSLGGTGTRMVVADANGDLNTQAIPGGGGGNDWSINGNSGTSAASNFVGTTDGQDFVMRTGNVERLRLKTTGILWQTLQPDCTVMGTNAFNGSASGERNTIFGTNAGTTITVGSSNTLMGYTSGATLTSGGGNVLIGTSSGNTITTGTSNVLVGSATGAALQTGGQNTLIGNNANVGGAAIASATAIGNGTVAGNNATAIGSGAGAAFFNATAIGNGAVAGATNAFVLGDNSVSVGIGVSSPLRRFHVAGTGGTPNVRLEALSGTGVRMVTTDVNGDLNATNAPAVASIDVSGSVAKGYTTLSANTTLDATHYTVRRFGGCNTITLPNANTCTRRIYVIINSSGLGAFTLTVTGGGQVYDDITNTNFAAGSNLFPATTRLQIQSDGTNWIVIGR